MFLEIVLTEIVVIEPEHLNDELDKNIEEIVRERFEGKIIKGKGICLKITNLKKIDAKVVNGTGNLDVKIKLSCVIFSSFRGEILKGKIKKSSSEGIEVDFCGVPGFIPSTNLFRNTD